MALTLGGGSAAKVIAKTPPKAGTGKTGGAGAGAGTGSGTGGPLDVATASLAQLQALANAQAAASSQAAQAPIQTQITAQQASDTAHAKAIQGFTTALVSLLQGAAPAVQNNYTTAANSDATYGKGFSDALQNIVNQSQGANNSFLSQMGAPAAATPTAPNVGDVTYGLGGVLPASTLQREGAAYGAAANLLPVNAATQGQQDLLTNQYADRSAVAKLQDQIATLAGKIPGQATSNLTTLEGVQSKQVANKINQQRLTDAEAKERDANTKTTIGYLLKQTTVDPKTGMVTMTPGARSELARLLNVPVSSITGVDASTMARIVQDQVSNGFTQARINETARHDTVTEGQGAARIQLAGLSAAETRRYHDATIRIRKATAGGTAPSGKDIRTAFTTAVKIGKQFLGKKSTVKVGSVSKSTYGPETSYPAALASMTSYWEGLGLDAATAAVKAKQTLAAIPGYKVPAGG